ncbi:NLR family CARD domain-containing protein 3 [Alosa sapidissima]|uniref:NLR family CARD domain-containing protein 3 n=1 Tax=Alosa sapidissima TaxID=34773 RepID=UPI001C0A6141|nr:NLR family CARD domain-containing protein 3 [Alosa sapidissima]
MDTQSEIPAGRGASIHGSEDGDDGMTWDRRSLDLPECDIQRAASPAPSYLSMKSDSMDCSDTDTAPEDILFKIEFERPESTASSVYSLESDEGVEDELKAELQVRRRPKNKKSCSGKPELAIAPNYKRHPALTVKYTFKLLQQVLKKLTEAQMKFFKKFLWERYPEFFRDPLDVLDLIDVVDKMLECCDIDISLNITQHVLEFMGLRKLVNYICGHLHRNEVRYGLKQQLREKYSVIHEGCPKNGGPADFESVYADHFITSGLYAPVNGEHELRGLVEELRVDKGFKYKPIKNTDIYNPEIVAERYLRLMVMRGIAGIGKTTAVQRFIMDWVNEKAHEEIYFVFPLSGEYVMQHLDEEKSLREILNELYPAVVPLADLEFEDCQLMFILDDADELVHELDFLYTHCWCDANTVVPVRNLFINLIKGNLLHYAFLWMVTRPLSSCALPSDRVNQVVEVRGFDEDARDQYFRKRFGGEKDPAQAERAVAYVRANKTIFIMCHLPMFCWVVSNYLRKVFKKYPRGQEPPGALTELYAHLVQVYFNMRERRERETGPLAEDKKWEDSRQLLMKMAKVAYTMLDKEAFHVSKSNWKDEDSDAKEAIVRSGLLSEYYRERFILYQEKIRCFIHPTVQEFMAALYVFLMFKNHGKNVLDTSKMSMIKLRDLSLADVYKSAVDKAVHSKAAAPRHYDLFLRFLAGMGAESTQRLLGDFINQVGCKNSALEDAAKALRRKMKEHQDRKETLEKCIEELYPTTNPTQDNLTA